MRKRLFIDAWPLTDEHISGIGHTTYSLVKHLDKFAEYEIILVIPSGAAEKLERWHFSSSVRVRTMPMPRRVFNRLNRYNLLPPIDLIIGKGIYIFPNYRNWRLWASPSYTFIHDLSFVRYPEFSEPRNQKMLAEKVPQWIRRSTKVLTISEFSKREIMDYYHVPKEKIAAIPLGVDRTVFCQQDSESVQKVMKDLSINGKYLLYVGNIEPRKNLLRLIDAYTKLPKTVRDEYSLVIVGGGGWLNEPILGAIKEAKANGHNIVQPTKMVTDSMLASLYSGATALVHVAVYEGFGLSPLQALSCNCPVVVADTSSLPEVVGKAGIYCNPTDVESITSALQRVLDKQTRNQILSFAPTQYKKFTWDKTAQQLIDVIANK